MDLSEIRSYEPAESVPPSRGGRESFKWGEHPFDRVINNHLGNGGFTRITLKDPRRSNNVVSALQRRIKVASRDGATNGAVIKVRSRRPDIYLETTNTRSH